MIKKIAKTAAKILLIIVIVAIVGVAGFIVAEPVIYSDFYGRNSQLEFDTPGASDGFIQQGFCSAGDDVMLVSGYMTDKTPSRIYTIKENDGDKKTSFVKIKDNDEKYLTIHAGGIAVCNDFVYVCNSEGDPSSVLVYSLNEILSAQEGDDVIAKDEFAVANGASFCTVSNGVLFVGEFYMEGKYETDDSHHLTTPAGDKHKAIVFAYMLNSDGSLADSPMMAISITDKIQGMAFADDKIVLSSSYGLATSQIYVYDTAKAKLTQDTITIDNQTISLVYLDSDSLTDTISAPPMAEEIVYCDGRLFVLNESASNKYIFGKLLRAKYVWSIEL